MVVTTVLALVAICCMVLFTYGIEKVLFIYVTTENSKPWTEYMVIFGVTTAAFYTILAITMLISYFYLIHTLSNFTHRSMQNLKKLINSLFATLVISYLVRSAILDG